MNLFIDLQLYISKTMADDVDSILENTSDLMTKAVNHLETDLMKIRAGKANPGMLEGIMVEYYGNPTPIAQVANISVLDARTITLQPWEKNMIQAIEKAIMTSNIGINPQNDGSIIRLFLPPLTEERRKQLVKSCNAEGENAKVSIRNIRRDGIENIKKLQKDGLSEDLCKNAEKEAQDITDKFTSLVEKLLAAKEKEIMVV